MSKRFDPTKKDRKKFVYVKGERKHVVTVKRLHSKGDIFVPQFRMFGFIGMTWVSSSTPVLLLEDIYKRGDLYSPPIVKCFINKKIESVYCHSLSSFVKISSAS